jgi:serine/threonine-protein kinase
VAIEQGKYDDADRYLRDGLAMRRELFGASPRSRRGSLRNLSQVAHVKQDLGGAEALIQRGASRSRPRSTASGDAHVAALLKDLGMVRLQRNELDTAAEALNKSLEIRRSVLGADHPDIAETLQALAMVEQNRESSMPPRRTTGKRWRYERASWARVTRTPRRTRNNLASLLYQRQDFAGAAPIFRESMELQREALGPDHPRSATSMANLGVTLMTLGDLDGAEPLYRDALRIRRRRTESTIGRPQARDTTSPDCFEIAARTRRPSR